jgi:hypothetical protein
MDKRIAEAQSEAVMLWGLASGLNILLDDPNGRNAVFPMADTLQERLEKLANKLEEIEAEGRK